MCALKYEQLKATNETELTDLRIHINNNRNLNTLFHINLFKT